MVLVLQSINHIIIRYEQQMNSVSLSYSVHPSLSDDVLN